MSFACHLLLSSTIHLHSKIILTESTTRSLLRGTALGPTASRVARNQNWYCEAEARVNCLQLEIHDLTLKNMQQRSSIDQHQSIIISIEASSRFKPSSSLLLSAPLPRSSCRCPGSSRSKGSTFRMQTFEASYPLTLQIFIVYIVFSGFFFHGNLMEFVRLFVMSRG